MASENNYINKAALADYRRRLVYWVWLANICGPGNISGNTILSKFRNDPELIYNTDFTGKRFEGITLAKTNALNNKDLREAEKIVSYCADYNVKIITLEDRKYPLRLKQILSRPLVLYCRGELPDVDANLCIAVVGTRAMTEYGSVCAYQFGYDMTLGGALVVSGMAAGSDTMAHIGALEAGGKTIAVLGSGIDVVYPADNGELMECIVKHGAVITEYKPGTSPSRENFPIRNRIISGLCQATLVTEAPDPSGALITARICLEQGRDLFAIPGKIGDLRSVGTNEIISDGSAKMVTSAADLLSKYASKYPHNINFTKISKFVSKKKSPLEILRTAGRKHISVPDDIYKNNDVRGNNRTIDIQRNNTAVGNDDSVEQNTSTTVAGGGKYMPGALNDGDFITQIPVDLCGEVVFEQFFNLDDAPEKASDYAKKPAHVSKTDKKKAAENVSGSDLREIGKTKPVPRPSESGKPSGSAKLGKSEQEIYNSMLDNESMSADEIIEKGFSASEVARAITLLELNGAVEALPGGFYKKIVL